jgi:hypothetical protein
MRANVFLLASVAAVAAFAVFSLPKLPSIIWTESWDAPELMVANEVQWTLGPVTSKLPAQARACWVSAHVPPTLAQHLTPVQTPY